MKHHKSTNEWGRATAKERHGMTSEVMGAPTTEQAPQDPIDKHGPGYDNDTSPNWLRGMGKGNAEGKPSFDKHKAGR